MAQSGEAEVPIKNLPAELSAATPRRVENDMKEGIEMKKSRQKNSPDTCPLAGTGREAIYNSSWQMRNKASITHSTSSGLVSSLFVIILVISIAAGFCRTGAGNIAQSNERIKL